jgi:hypothetical protein
MGFSAAGFFGQVNADITEKRQYIRTRVEEDRKYLREQGLKRQAGIQDQRQQYEQAARSLVTRGADERLVMTTLEMDPGGLMELYRRTDSDNSVTGNNLNDMMSIAGDYRSESTMGGILDSILPTVQALPNDTSPVASRRSSLGSFLGLNLDDALSNQVYNEQIVGGMTGDQIMAGMNLPVQAEGSDIGGVTFDFSSLGAATLSTSDINAHIRTMNDEYNLEAKIGSLKAERLDATGDGQLLIDNQIKDLEAVDSLSGVSRLNAIFAMPGITVGPTTRMLIGNHGESLFSNTNGFNNPTLGTLLGASSSDTSDAAINASGTPDVAADAVVTPEVEVTPPDEIDAVPVGTPAIPVTRENIEPFVNSLRAFNPESPGVVVAVEGGAPFVVTPDMATGEGDPNLLKTLIPGYTPESTDFDNFYRLKQFETEPSVPSRSTEQTLRDRGASEEQIQNLMSSLPSSQETPINTQQAIADQSQLQQAFSSGVLDQEELDDMRSAFVAKYGEEAARAVIAQTQNPG